MKTKNSSILIELSIEHKTLLLRGNRSTTKVEFKNEENKYNKGISAMKDHQYTKGARNLSKWKQNL